MSCLAPEGRHRRINMGGMPSMVRRHKKSPLSSFAKWGEGGFGPLVTSAGSVQAPSLSKNGSASFTPEAMGSEEGGGRLPGRARGGCRGRESRRGGERQRYQPGVQTDSKPPARVAHVWRYARRADGGIGMPRSSAGRHGSERLACFGFHSRFSGFQRRPIRSGFVRRVQLADAR